MISGLLKSEQEQKKKPEKKKKENSGGFFSSVTKLFGGSGAPVKEAEGVDIVDKDWKSKLRLVVNLKI